MAPMIEEIKIQKKRVKIGMNPAGPNLLQNYNSQYIITTDYIHLSTSRYHHHYLSSVN